MGAYKAYKAYKAYESYKLHVDLIVGLQDYRVVSYYIRIVTLCMFVIRP